MTKVTLTLNEDLFQQLQDAALQNDRDVETFLTNALHRQRPLLFPQPPKQWMSREQWEARVSGKHCPMCTELAADEPVNAYGYTIADLQISRLRLGSDQFMPGYCVLISKKHISEVHHLTNEEQRLYFEDMTHAAQAIEKVFHPIKMNFEILGNALPHLHCHIKPRYYGDAAPGEPLYPDKGTLFLTPQEYEEHVHLIREAL